MGLVCLLPLLLVAGGCGGCGNGQEQVVAEPAATPEVLAPPAPEPEDRPAETPRTGLRATIDAEDQRVEGSYDDLGFEAELVAENQARARFDPGEGAVLVVEVRGPRSGTVEWRGTSLDGNGAPTAAEIELLADLETVIPTKTLALIALDLACEPGAEQLDPAVGAALLMPYQMQLYYRTPADEVASSIRALASRSRCQHLRRPTEELDPEGTPSPSVVALTTDQPVPLAYGYFPFTYSGETE